MLAKFSTVTMSQRELLSQDNLYVYARGNKFVVLLTNGQTVQNVKIGSTPFAAGDKVCNLFNVEDCQTVGNGGSIVANLMNGEAKVLLKQADLE